MPTPACLRAEVAAIISGCILNKSQHIQDTIPLNLDSVERVCAEEKPDRKE